MRSTLILLGLLPLSALAEPAALDTMTIIGEEQALTRTVGSAHSVDPEQLELFGHDDINRVLRWVPGLYVREEDGFGLRPNIGLRGANSDRSQKVTLMEDGVLFGPAPYAAPAAYYFPLTSRMVGVEVFKGPAAIAHGPQTIGGAINLLSAPVPPVSSGLASVALGGDGYRRLHGRAGGTAESGLGWLAEGVHIGSDGFKQLDGGGDTGFAKTELLGKIRHDLGAGQLEWRLGYAQEVSDETYLGLTEADFRADPYRRYRASANDRMEWDWWGLRADYSAAAFGGALHVTAYHHLFDRAWNKFNNLRDRDIRTVLANPDTPSNRLAYGVLTGAIDSDPDAAEDDILIGTNDRSMRSSGLQGRLRWDWQGRWPHRLEAGVRLHADRITRLHDEDSFDMRDGELVRSPVPRAITADNTGRAEAVALWVRDELSSGRLSLVPGLRIEHVRVHFADRRVGASGRDDYSIALPGLGLNFAQRPGLTWLAGIHRGFSPASPGLNAAEPEDAINFEAGLRWNEGWGRLELIGFHSDYRNLTAQCTFSAGCDDATIGQQTNAGSARVQGLEAAWEWRWSLAAFDVPLNLHYTYTAAEFREAFTSTNPQLGEVEAGFELPYLPAHRAGASLGLAAARWQFSLAANYVSEMRDAAGTGPIREGSDAATVLDLAADWRWSDQLRLNARIDNLLDREYLVSRRPFGARPGKPLTVQVGVDWRY